MSGIFDLTSILIIVEDAAIGMENITMENSLTHIFFEVFLPKTRLGNKDTATKNAEVFKIVFLFASQI